MCVQRQSTHDLITGSEVKVVIQHMRTDTWSGVDRLYLIVIRLGRSATGDNRGTIRLDSDGQTHRGISLQLRYRLKQLLQVF